MTLNSDVYLTRWVGVQQPVNLECGVGFTTNGPDAEVKGAELELQVKLTEPFTLSQNIGYSHAAFTSSFVSANVVEGQRLFDSPLWTINTTLEFQHRYADQRSMFATATYSFVSNMTELTAAIHTVPDRRNVNSRIGIDAGRWSVALFANNLFNQRYPSQYFNLQGLTGPPYDRITTNQPRTAGVDVNVSF